MDEVPAQAAPETAETAPAVEATVSVETTPEQPTEQPKAEKKFSQAEVEAIVGKRLARAERKWQSEYQRQAVQPEQPKPEQPSKPSPDKYASTEEYIEAVSDWKAKQVVEQTLSEREKQHREEAARKAQAAAYSNYARREESARIAYEDFDDVVYNPSVPITDAMVHAIQHEERGPDIAYHLGKNPQEAARIAQLPPFLQAKEIGKLAVKLPDPTPAKTTTSAPAPIRPLAGKTTIPVHDTTDPRSTKTMSTSEWINANRERKRKELEARGYR